MKNRFLLLALILAGVLPARTSYGVAGDLYESDFSTGTIFQFRPTPLSDGTLVKTKFASGLENVRGLAFDRFGNLFVGQSTTIIKITPEGFISVFASNIHGPNFLTFNRDGYLFVTDRDGNVLRYSPQGVVNVYVPNLDKPTGIAFDAADNLFVADFGSEAIFKVTPSGDRSTFALNVKAPQGLAFDSQGFLYVTSATNGTVEGFTPLGERFIRAFNIASPAGLVFDKDDNLWVADNCNGTGTNSIIKFSTDSDTGAVFAEELGCPLQLAFEPPRDPLFNISTRALVEPVLNGELIGGFIITGNEPKTVLVRAIGPSLAKSGVTLPLLDPILELHTPDGVIVNDNWMDSQKSEIQATGLAPKDDRESAILITLNPGSYTAVVHGKPPGVAGTAVVEIYDANLAADSSIANISSRGYVQTGDDRMVAGFIVGGGNGAGKILVRGLGPSLAQAGISNPLPDPYLTLFDSNGTQLASNDDWAETQAYAIFATGIPPESSLESAIVINVPDGQYTAILEDVNGNSGVGLIEVYNLR